MRLRSLTVFTAVVVLMAMTMPGAADAKPPNAPTELTLSLSSPVCDTDGSLALDVQVSVDQGSAYLTAFDVWADKWMAMTDVNAIDGVGSGLWELGNWNLWYGENISVANWSDEQRFDRRAPEAEVTAGVPWIGAFDTNVFTRHGFTNAYVFADPGYQGWWHVNAWARASAKGGDLWSQGGDDSGFWVDCTTPSSPQIVLDSDFPATLDYCEQDSPTGEPYMWAELPDGSHGQVPCQFDYPEPWPSP